MNFQVNLENMNAAIIGYSEIINEVQSGLNEVLNAVKTLGEEAWSGVAQKGYDLKIAQWQNECQNFLADFRNSRDILKRNIPIVTELLEEGMSLGERMNVSIMNYEGTLALDYTASN